MFRQIADWFRRSSAGRELRRSADPRHALGEAGERVAEQHLAHHLGMKILARRFRAHGGEIDLVCRDKATIVFVEVKTRRDEKFMDAIDAVTPEKQRKMITAANAYLHRHRMEDRAARFDVITVVGVPPHVQVRHAVDAFSPGG